MVDRDYCWIIINLFNGLVPLVAFSSCSLCLKITPQLKVFLHKEHQKKATKGTGAFKQTSTVTLYSSYTNTTR
jgi:hypothetical protein